MHPLAIAGFLTALAAVHAVLAAYCLRDYLRAPGARKSADHALLLFGLLNVAIVAFDGGLAGAHAGPSRVALAVAEAGRIAAVVVLFDYVLHSAGAPRARWSTAAIYAVGGFLEVAGVLGLLRRGAPGVADVEAPATMLGAAFAVIAAFAAFYAAAALGSAYQRGRRGGTAFAGAIALGAASFYDAFRSLGIARGPSLAPLGLAAFVCGVMMTLLSRFAALRGRLEARALELKERSRQLSVAYDELRAAQDELVKKQQLAVVGELAAVIAHEVRNPLAIMSNAVATLRRSGIAEGDRDTLLQILDEEGSRLNRLVGDLLCYARPVRPERQQVSLRDLVERALGLAEGHDDLHVELVEPEPVERISGDPDLLRQVVDNLVTNAIQAMAGGGGTLTVTLARAAQEGRAGVELQVQDTGEGMDTQVRSRALDPFFTTRPSGTGLGLAIVARIVDAHGGALRIRSAAGAGTAVIVFLPCSGEGPPPSSTAEPRSSGPPILAEVRRAIGR